MSRNVPFAEVKETIKKALINAGLSEEQAEICAEIHAESSADGVESHGLNRVPRFVEYVQKGWVDPGAKPELIRQRGGVEIYDGHLGIGITNALFAEERAVALAREHGIGMCALRNTTHWMRGGTYAWKMAEAGFVGISWINTESCMPLWGSDEKSVGNNPFCMAVPRDEGPIVLDMAMSQYAYGKLGVYRLAGKQLPFPGGYDRDGNLTSDPGAIEDSMRILPMGYWKGSGMAIVLDLAAAILSDGRSGSDMDAEGRGSCTGCSQIFIAMDPGIAESKEEMEAIVNRRIEAADNAHPIKEGSRVRVPGEGTLARRKRSMAEGVTVDETVWAQVQSLAAGNMETTDIASR
ncbi:3-dehydro-L-gulonate 2-dehydrogenase [Galactobacillus timonensis]|uniref:3-dehydro-L-gulonate 2-dehydrogenase n=1 Tax=Galactobacillus timonensis TaxID=2041840 RepID=UPI000EBF9541|nr:3-dehydro-L-gulonate 2-dehydrogenase [Galactobacillus timonensis]MDD6369178.1 3-dehydro-L-gulonate 2-dehydrogenase [Galactobacillus timonensis]MDD6679616.1 3-dehydro-L-gulonate 2-dehydrogenase [Galactobacillus timonensis]HCW54901.1 3-dehydro-L-gulonate 2-dehydrogenase [Erysipelotrichaceae bacterium]